MPHEEDTEEGVAANQGWVRGVRPERRPFAPREIKLPGPPPVKLECPQDLGVTILGHLIVVATSTTGHTLDLNHVVGIVHTEQQRRGAAKKVINNSVFLGYPMEYGPAATGLFYKHTVLYTHYLDVDTDTMVRVEPPLKEVRDLLGEEWPCWQLAATADDVELETESSAATWRNVRPYLTSFYYYYHYNSPSAHL